MPIESMFDDLEKSSIHLIAVITERIVAAGRVHFNSPNQAQIRFMCVDKDFRREGLGSKILSELEKHALKEGCSEVMLNARDIAMNFYLSSGYKKIRTYTSETGLPHTQMKKIF
jgi:predicted GNAT family N-acyltransferase